MAQNHQKRDRWLEMYADGIITKEELTEKKVSVDSTIASLKKRQAELSESLQELAMTPETIEDILEFAAEIRDGLDLADKDFTEKR